MRKLFPVTYHKSCRKGWGAGERLFAGLRGISCCPMGYLHGYDPAAREGWGMLTLGCLGLGATKHLMVTWPRKGCQAQLLGDNHRHRPLSLVCGKQARVIVVFWCIGKICLDFYEATFLQQKLSAGKPEIPAWKRRMLELPEGGLGILHQAEGKQRQVFFVQPSSQKRANYLGWRFWRRSVGENQLITDVHCVKFNSKLNNCKQDFSSFYSWHYHFVFIKQ